MNLEDVYNVADGLGMIESADHETTTDISYVSERLRLAKAIKEKDILTITNFVNNLTLNNDLSTLKQYLIVLLSKLGD